MASESFLRFVPTRAEGWEDVTDVVITHDHIDFQSAGEWKTYQFEEMAQWPRPIRLRKLLARITGRYPFLPIGERDWFHEEGNKIFRFYTNPPLTIFLPAEENIDYGQSLFRRIQNVISPYTTWDLG